MTVRKRDIRTRGMTPVERAMLVAEWKADKVVANIQALAGGDGVKLVHAAGKILYVVLGAALRMDRNSDEPDLRIVRATVNALHEQAENHEVDETRRASIVAGLQACERLIPTFSQRAISEAALELRWRLAVGDMRYSDFEPLMAPRRKAA